MIKIQIEELIELAKRAQAQQDEAQTVEVKAAYRGCPNKLRDTRSGAERAHSPRLQHLYQRNAASDRLFQRPSGDPQPRFAVWPYVGRGFGGCAPGRTQSGACSDDREPDRCRAPRTRKEIAEFLGIETVYHANKRYIQPLVEQGRLKLGIPDKPSSRKQTFTTVQKQGEVL